jgi:hypothetical protein
VRAVAVLWSVTYLVLGLAWLAGAGGNPADPAVDSAITEEPVIATLGLWGPHAGAAIMAVLGGAGVVLSLAMRLTWHRPRRFLVVLAAVLGLTLAVVIPDYRLLAMVAYTPIIGVLALFGAVPQEAQVWPWPLVNLGILTVAGLTWLVLAKSYAGARSGAAWMTPARAQRWGRWAVGVAVAVPVGYAVTRFAWALGIPLGVSRDLLDDLGDGKWAGAALATLAVGGAVLTLGLVQRWGEVFPRWMPVVRGRTVPVGLATVPARIVAVIVTSAGLMFVRISAGGLAGDAFPFEGSADVAAWLPELFWPLWGAALAVASYTYEARRRGVTTGPEAVTDHEPVANPA